MRPDLPSVASSTSSSTRCDKSNTLPSHEDRGSESVTEYPPPSTPTCSSIGQTNTSLSYPQLSALNTSLGCLPSNRKCLQSSDASAPASNWPSGNKQPTYKKLFTTKTERRHNNPKMQDFYSVRKLRDRQTQEEQQQQEGSRRSSDDSDCGSESDSADQSSTPSTQSSRRSSTKHAKSSVPRQANSTKQGADEWQESVCKRRRQMILAFSGRSAQGKGSDLDPVVVLCLSSEEMN